MNSKVPTRVLYGAVMMAMLAGLLYLDWWIEGRLRAGTQGPDALRQSPLYCLPTTLVLLGLSVKAFFELRRLARACGAKVLPAAGMIATVGLVTFPYWYGLLSTVIRADWLWQMPPVLMFLWLAVAGVCAEQMIRHRTTNALPNIAATLLSVLYLGIGGAIILAIRRIALAPLVMFLVAVKFTDIGAYFTGVLFGRHKMIPWLSAGKTWEGLAGGLVVGVGVAVLGALVWLGESTGAALGRWAAFAAVVALAGQFADLCESLLKRSADVKDSGAVVPEFGGVLDIIDSPLLAAPVAFIALGIIHGS